MYNLWYDFFIQNFFNGVVPSISWQVTTLEIASIVMSFGVVLLAIILICAFVSFILHFARGLLGR